MIDFIRGGLEAGERCVYVCHDSPEQFRQALWEAGIDVDGAEHRGALAVLTRTDVYLPDGRFNADRTLALIRGAFETLGASFTGLRMAGDMSWLQEEPPGCDEALLYEALINQVCDGRGRGIVVCFYHRRRLPRKVLDWAVSTHPVVLIGGKLRVNQFYLPPAVAQARKHSENSDVSWKLRELER